MLAAMKIITSTVMLAAVAVIVVIMVIDTVAI
jgi:hypothetical protein